ncbi:uncharacterized protein M6B38_308385 [Iris pallida]|uniref:Uncharacterized protein n=1 Tax=Iris pallida TaxID=29817 RepID=A0AAX6HKW8_IRIPA|nr:uncharacterized protein M6B38_197855 [Iris pallida]KAJ6841402.1 uncharacterized protein M6B38_308385 [Iris pallida]
MKVLSRAKRLFLSSSTPKDKAANGEKKPVVAESGPKKSSNHLMVHSGFGSKEEAFFDSRAWLDSDCEDDFYSVNGEFTPSRGSTPDYQISAPATPQWSKSFSLSQIPDTKLEPSPIDGKKKLSDLLKESLKREHGENDQNDETDVKLDSFVLKNGHPPRSSEGTPYYSGTNSEFSSEVTPGSNFIHRKDRTGKTKYCCFPSLMPSRNFNDTRKQRMSPEH